MKPLSLLCALALGPALASAEPRIQSWFTDNSGQYARLYQTTAEEATGPGAAVTTWNRGQGVQAQPTYAGIHEVSFDATDVFSVNFRGTKIAIDLKRRDALTQTAIYPRWSTGSGRFCRTWPRAARTQREYQPLFQPNAGQGRRSAPTDQFPLGRYGRRRFGQAP